MPRKTAAQRKAEAAAALVGQTAPGPASMPTIQPAKSGAKVTIACKMHVPWFDLELCAPQEKYENTQTGPRKITEWARTGQIVRVRGTAYPVGQAPEGFGEKPRMIEGAALTPGVSKDFWDQWKDQHKHAPYVINRMIFACETEDQLAGIAKELRDVKSGLEPIQHSVKNKSITDARVVKPALKELETLAPGEK